MSDEQNTDPRAPAQPMSPERLDNIRQHVTGGGDGLCKSEARDLLADRDRHAAELADAREAIKRLEADHDRISTMLRISLSRGAGS